MDREHRVRRREEFSRLRQRGRRLAHPLLRLQWVANALPVTRFGFVVGKRVAMRAHERNLVRRRLRELARAKLPGLAAGHDIVISAQPAARLAGWAELAAALEQLLRRAHLERAVPPDGPAGP
ncbi:MAG TPA: ribonuclease P protein component [Chloroflexota bacterium]|nr:ribonuclease P protein component [Chloroflexota bacterium]